MSGPVAPKKSAGESDDPTLRVTDLRTSFMTDGGEVRAVDGVSFDVAAGETLALVGESGSGKSATAHSILRLIPEPPGRILGGSSVRLAGRELLELSERELSDVRGRAVGMVFQEPMTSLNPVLRVGDQIGEALRRHRGLRGGELRDETVRLLGLVDIPEPGERYRAYPHELSGGMRQRVVIAMAVSCQPALLIADEPTTALDVTVQAQVLDLLARLQRELGMALMLISHDLGVVATAADRVAVMYAGRIVEEAPATELFRRPRHPYTEGLLRAVPDIDHPARRLAVIPGQVPHPLALPDGCRFEPRCPYAWERCVKEDPVAMTDGSATARCWTLAEPARRAGPGYASVGSDGDA